jgi:microcystin degradation protein MlrC
MKRIAIAGFQHETNTFSPGETTLTNFTSQGAWPAMTRGTDIFEVFKNLNIPISGFINNCPHNLEPILWAMAEPGGYVTEDTFESISNEIVEGIVSLNPDGVYLDLHGAMVTKKFDDAEAELLRRIREKMGYAFPIAISLDLHANISRALFNYASVISIYRTYPHIDFAQTGARASSLLDRVFAGPLARAFRQGDYLVPITAQSTEYEPAQFIYARLPEFSSISVDLAMGFPPADIPDCGPAIVSYADLQADADNNADQLLKFLNTEECRFDARLVSAEQAVTHAMGSSGPVIISDPQDNPGAGGTGDTTGILRELISAEAEDAILGVLHDPVSAKKAHNAGLNAIIEVELGGGHPEFSQPLKAEVHVEALSNGKFLCSGPMFGGSKANLGLMACLRLSNSSIKVVIGTERCQNLDQEFFRVVGIEPAEYGIICVKSAIHFIADYKQITNDIIFASSPGANPCELEKIAHTQLRPGLRIAKKNLQIK